MPRNLGLEGAYAAGSLQALLRQRMQDRIEEERRRRHDLESDRNFGLAQQAQADTSALRRATLEAAQASREATLSHLVQSQRDAAAARATGPMAIGDPVEPDAFKQTFAGTASESAFAPEKTLPATQMVGGATLGQLTRTKADPTVTGRLTYGGSDAQKQSAKDQAEIDALLSDPKTPEPIKGFLRVRGAIPKGESVPAQLFADQKPAGAEPLEQVMEGGKPVYRPRSQAAGKEAYHAPKEPKAPSLMVVDTVDASGMPVKKVVEKKAGDTFSKPPSAVTANRLDSAAAVEQTGNDIIARLSDPAFQKVVGPAMGRASSLQDFIGNPPPEFSELAGQIESYALANMGVHGMRSAQGAEQIKHLLTQHHTPASLIAAVKGLNGFSRHFMENAGRERDTRSTPGPAADGLPTVGSTFQGGKVLKVEKVP